MNTQAETAGQLVSLLRPSFDQARQLLSDDADFIAASRGVHLTFAIQTNKDNDGVVFVVEQSSVSIGQGDPSDAAFTIRADFSHWSKFFQEQPVRFYQSIWGMLRIHGKDQDVTISGDAVEFSRAARIWRIVLDKCRSALTGRAKSVEDSVPAAELAQDHLIGRYLHLELPVWGRCKIFYESSGEGDINVVFLHTAGADGRQNHAVMNDPSMRRRCRMFTFDLPSHGRSYPSELQPAQAYANNEDQYVSAIGKFIKALGINEPIVCGASMGGHVCLAVAARAKELGVRGVIPLEGCDHLPFIQPAYERGGTVNDMILHPERVSGMIAPTAPDYYKRLLWWIYSSQGVGIFEGDLRFYFSGWDGRQHLAAIDTKFCPVYMLTGEFDYSCTAEDSERTAQQISGAKFQMMTGLGHFPLTEDPEQFLPYMHEALDHVIAHRNK